MEIFIQTILYRIKAYGQKLSSIANFTGKTWVLHGNTDGYTTYRFQPNGKLLIAVDGIVHEKEWQFFPPDSLYIKSGEIGDMFRQAFFLDALFIMEREGNSFDPILFFNEAEISNGDVITYLKKIYANKTNLVALDEKGLYYYNGRDSKQLMLGDKLYESDFELVGSKKIFTNFREIEVQNGVVVSIRHIYNLDTNRGWLFIKSKNKWSEKNSSIIGSEVCTENGTIAEGIYKIKGKSKILRLKVRNGIIIWVVKIPPPFIFILTGYIILFIIFVYFSKKAN